MPVPSLTRRAVVRSVLPVLFALGAGCRHLKSAQPVPEPPKTMLHVTNGEFLDAVVYVVDRGQHVRLGVATSNRTTTFEIPSHLVFAPRPLSFQVHPIGGSTRPSSGDVVIEPGDEIDLQLNGGRVVLTKRLQ
jgi:hypothetical protein